MAENVILTTEEAQDLVYTIMDGVASVDGEGTLPTTWAAEMRDWCILILDRLAGE